MLSWFNDKTQSTHYSRNYNLSSNQPTTGWRKRVCCLLLTFNLLSSRCWFALRSLSWPLEDESWIQTQWGGMSCLCGNRKLLFSFASGLSWVELSWVELDLNRNWNQDGNKYIVLRPSSRKPTKLGCEKATKLCSISRSCSSSQFTFQVYLKGNNSTFASNSVLRGKRKELI